MKKQIPNLITLCNLLCGVVASYYAVQGHTYWAGWFILLGVLFDFFDGMAARLLGVSSPMGKELDSLADVVTSGVAPGFIFLHILMNAGWGGWSCVSLLIPLFAAYRLAKFNIDTRQSHSFLGLPVPSFAMIWVATGMVYGNQSIADVALLPTRGLSQWMFGTAGLVTMVVVELIGCYMMVSEIPLFALKVKSLKWKDNKVRYLFLMVDAVLLVLLGIWALPIIIVWYVLLSIITPKSAE